MTRRLLVILLAFLVLGIPTASASARVSDSVVIAGKQVTLLRVKNAGAAVIIRIGNHRHRLAAGASAQHILVRAIVDPCADFRYQRRQRVRTFTLCVR